MRYAIGLDFPVLILGMRGASGDLPLIAAWGQYLKDRNLLVLLIADGDVAGGTWFRTTHPQGRIPKPSFAERLDRGCHRRDRSTRIGGVAGEPDGAAPER